jgi:IclR helix-turn-helix domain
MAVSVSSGGTRRARRPAAAAERATGAGRASRTQDGRTAAPEQELAEVPEGIVIELDRAQVGQVLRAASDVGIMSVVLTGLGDLRETLSQGPNARRPAQMDDPRLSRSLLLGLLVLAALPADGSYRGIADVARMTGMNGSTTHRYMSTLLAVGLAERDPGTRKYRLVSDERLGTGSARVSGDG